MSIHIATALRMSCTISFFLLWPTFTNIIFLAIGTKDRFRNMIFFTELGTEQAPNRGSYFIIIKRKCKQREKSISSLKFLLTFELQQLRLHLIVLHNFPSKCILLSSQTHKSIAIYSVQLSSFTQSCPTLCDTMNCSTPGFPVHHQIPEFTQTHVH